MHLYAPPEAGEFSTAEQRSMLQLFGFPARRCHEDATAYFHPHSLHNRCNHFDGCLFYNKVTGSMKFHPPTSNLRSAGHPLLVSTGLSWPTLQHYPGGSRSLQEGTNIDNTVTTHVTPGSSQPKPGGVYLRVEIRSAALCFTLSTAAVSFVNSSAQLRQTQIQHWWARALGLEALIKLI